MAMKDAQSESIDLICEFFNNDLDKVVKWFITKNPLLGDVAPAMYFLTGRENKLLKFIKTQINENQRAQEI